MKVYISGPMRGIAEWGFPAFFNAGAALKAAGHDVFNPAENDDKDGFPWQGATGNESLAGMGFNLREALSNDMRYIAEEADAICVLPGWPKSSGARAELSLAAAIGLRAGTVEMFLAQPFESLPTAASLLEPQPIPAEDNHPDVKSNEVRITNAKTGGQKGKKIARMDLIPVEALVILAEHYGRGAEKYDDNQWRKGYDWSLSYASLLRHALSFWGGEDYDSEPPYTLNLAAVAWHAFALLVFMTEHPELDDRPTTIARQAQVGTSWEQESHL